MEIQTMNTTTTLNQPTNAIVAAMRNSPHSLLHGSITHIPHTPITMSSLEIAEMLGSQHTNVKISIERLMVRGTIQAPALQELRTPSGQTSKAYIFTGEQGKRDSTIVVAQLSPEFTATLVDRWGELEAQVDRPTPVNLDDPASLRSLLLGYTEKVMQLEHKVSEDAPKVEFYEDVAVAANCHSMKQVADILGTGRNNLFKYLRKKKVLISDGKNHNLPYQTHKDAGRFVVIEAPYKNPYTGELILNATTHVTGKGLIWIQELIAKHGRDGL